MVVGDLGIIEHFLRLQQNGSFQRFRKGFIITQSFQYARALGINIIAKESGIYTRVSGDWIIFNVSSAE